MSIGAEFLYTFTAGIMIIVAHETLLVTQRIATEYVFEGSFRLYIIQGTYVPTP